MSLTTEVAQDDAALATQISAFRRLLPGWWFSVGECSVSADASCGPDIAGPDKQLLKIRLFDEGFHADIPQPATMAEALMHVTGEACQARAQAIRQLAEDTP